MITVYRKKAIPKGMEKIELNDLFFNRHTSSLLDDRAKEVIFNIDCSVMVNRYTIISRFDGVALNTDRLSTGCKTALNVLYNPDKVFDIKECGDNALDVIFAFEEGNVYCDYPMISFEMDRVKACDGRGTKELDSYEDLKEWWSRED